MSGRAGGRVGGRRGGGGGRNGGGRGGGNITMTQAELELAAAVERYVGYFPGCSANFREY